MVEFLAKHNEINRSQHGLLKNIFTCVLEEMTTWVDAGSQDDEIYIDFQIPFDKVPNQILYLN